MVSALPDVPDLKTLAQYRGGEGEGGWDGGRAGEVEGGAGVGVRMWGEGRGEGGGGARGGGEGGGGGGVRVLGGGKVAELIEHFRSELIGAGWDLYEEEGSFGIATRFKNGKPKKTASVLIRYFDRSTEVVFDLEAEELKTVPRELTGREKPWRVDSWRFKEGKTMAELQRAFAHFMAEARASNPQLRKAFGRATEMCCPTPPCRRRAEARR